MNKNKIASDIAATLSLRYLLLKGFQPSRETITRWINELISLSEYELLEIGGNETAQENFIRRMR